jgi:probable phosphoglycerate mutase
MKIILVRHGETAENQAHRHQPEHTPLTITGRKQAVIAGEKLGSIGATHIVSSPLVRTLQTASLIADQLDMIPSIDYSLVELKRPPTMTGHTHRSFRSLFFYQRWYIGLTRVGESYRQIRERVKEAQINLVRLPSDATVVVVSHSVFISIFLAHMCNARMMNPIQAARTFLKLVKMKNTAMFELTYTPIENGCQWQRTNDLNLS